jgi:hypothetical protein
MREAPMFTMLDRGGKGLSTDGLEFEPSRGYTKSKNAEWGASKGEFLDLADTDGSPDATLHKFSFCQRTPQSPRHGGLDMDASSTCRKVFEEKVFTLQTYIETPEINNCNLALDSFYESLHSALTISPMALGDDFSEEVMDLVMDFCWGCEKNLDTNLKCCLHPILRCVVMSTLLSSFFNLVSFSLSFWSRVNCCSTCERELKEVDKTVQYMIACREERRDHDDCCDDSVSSDEMEECCGCYGNIKDHEGEDYDLLQCNRCPRAFCKNCVAKASSWATVEELAAEEKQNEPWNCIYCNPTPELVRMQ